MQKVKHDNKQKNEKYEIFIAVITKHYTIMK